MDATDSGAKTLALIVEDPDAPQGPFVHWVLYNIPPSTKELPEGASRALPEHAIHGTNSFGRTGWSGPCPRAGAARHRYVFTLYALDEEITGALAPNKDALISLMSGHVIAQTQLVGTYELKERRAEAPV